MTITPQSPARPGVSRRFATFRAVSALILREMGARYGRSPGGYIWALLEPLGGIVLLSVGFSLLIRNPPLGNSFILFYATGFLPFSAYQAISATVARAIMFSRPLLQYPVVTWVDAVIARFTLNALTGVLVTLILLAALIPIVNARILIEINPILAAIALTMLLGAGVGVLNCALFGLFPVWEQIWSIVTRPLFLASGVILIMEDLSQILQDILWYNPLMHITGLMRMGFYPTYKPDYIDIAFVAASGLIPLFLGVVLMGRYHQDILNNR